MEVVRRVGDPLRAEPAVILVEVDGDHLPVGLVVVDAVEARAPGVVGEEEPVLADRPAALADDAALVDEPPVLLPDLRVLERGRGGCRARDVAAEEQREREEPVPEPRQQAPARQAADSGAELVLLLVSRARRSRPARACSPRGRADARSAGRRATRTGRPAAPRGRPGSSSLRQPAPRRLRRRRTARDCSPPRTARRPSGRTSRPSCSGRSARRPEGSRGQPSSPGFLDAGSRATLREGRIPKAIWTSSGVRKSTATVSRAMAR